MDKLPGVSIVIPNYNYAHFVGEAIESALAQDHPACEVIVVDDCSTDASRSVIERYADRVRTVFLSRERRAVGGDQRSLASGSTSDPNLPRLRRPARTPRGFDDRSHLGPWGG